MQFNDVWIYERVYVEGCKCNHNIYHQAHALYTAKIIHITPMLKCLVTPSHTSFKPLIIARLAHLTRVR